MCSAQRHEKRPISFYVSTLVVSEEMAGQPASRECVSFSTRCPKALDLSAVSVQWAKRLYPDSPQPPLDRSEESNECFKKCYLII